MSGIRYIRLDNNLGVAGARNIGISESRGEYVTFLDDDDVRLPGSLDNQIRAFGEIPGAGFVYGPVMIADSDCNPTGKVDPIRCPTGDVFWQILKWNFVHCMSGLIRKSCLAEVGMFNPELPGLDWDLWVRLAERFPVGAVQEPVGIYRSPNPLSDQDSARPARILMTAAGTYRSWLNLPRAVAASRDQRDQARKSFLDRASDALIFGASDALELGAGRIVRENVLAALQLNPTRAFRPLSVKLLVQAFFKQTATASSVDMTASS
jgi:glycosyltransferase involved in cell wall biosynthesis